MATQKRKNKPKKRKGKITIAQNAVIRKRKHSTKSDSIPKAKSLLPRDNGANFKIKIRKK